ncbi:Lovastatin diketide synthase LovF 4 [Colletotrichum chlorophyti]|uniref:Lovastatin diketide synthase LovF 4 n=1 Tax=Colletotrichum chlorophyti TaxID=708187 RepID=A0A1Q8S605_9PEZI|nr:Lovastatin diketide synthase LovF 4 [Colletotrichum chlorophyti]
MSKPEPIAICGIGLRLPGGINTTTSLYDFLISRKDAKAKPNQPRYNSHNLDFTASGKSGSLPAEEGYWLSHDDVTKFDPSLFLMNPKEMSKLDPQQRLLLQVVWEALENAGEIGWQGQKIGCYVGSFGDDWREMHAVDTQDDGMYRLTGYMDFAQANRISHVFDLTGPSMTIRTACSAAGLAVHLACQAIRAGECDSAIVAGANLILSPGFTKLMAEQSVLSPDVSCKAFDAGANGYARAEAVNCLFLKKLDCAIREGNPVRAVIRGSATNSDGRTLGLTTPSAQAQRQLIRDAYRAAGISENDMWQTAMVECHGTGTAVGDTIEANTVASLFGGKGMLIGSVKPNLGHSEAASAITSIVKAVLSLETRTIIPNIKFKNPSVRMASNDDGLRPDLSYLTVPFESAGLRVPTEQTPWPEDRAERIGVNSFGIGGTNVHIILESAASVSGPTSIRGPGNMETPPPSPPPRIRRELATLLLFSAANDESLKRMVDGYHKFLNDQPSSLGALAHTLMHRRSHLGFRTYAIVTDDCDRLVFNRSIVPSFKPNLQSHDVAFIFTGQGAQWARMGAQLLKSSREFLRDIRDIDAILKSLPQGHRPEYENPMNFSQYDIVLTGVPEGELMRSDATSRLGEAEFAQPICTALQIALVRHLERYGITPKAVVGHSSGEIAAAYAAGILTMKEAILVAYYRGYTAKTLRRQGAMAAIGLGRDEVCHFIPPGVTIACENSNSNVTLSGDAEVLQKVCKTIQADKPDAFVRLLKVDKAYHSHHMRAIGAEYQSIIKPHLNPNTPKIAFFSSVTGRRLEKGSDFGSEYWQRNMESPVLFRQAATKLLQTSSTTLHVEVGPHSALAGPLKQICFENAISPPYVSVQNRGSNGLTSFLAALGELHCRGVAVNFPESDGIAPLTNLPTYPWNLTKSYWSDSRVTKAWQFPEHPPHELLGSRALEDSSTAMSWRRVLSIEKVPWLSDHCVGSDIVFPAAGYIAMAGEVVRQLTGQDDYTVRDMSVTNALVLTPGQEVELMTSARRERLTYSDESGWWELTIQSCVSAGNWTTHCTCRVRDGKCSQGPDLSGLKDDKFLRSVDAPRWYKAMLKAGYNYGPLFRGMHNIHASVTSPAAIAEVLDEQDASLHHSPHQHYSLHPRTVDQALQTLIVANSMGQPRLLNQIYLPTHINEIYISTIATSKRLMLQTLKSGESGTCHGDSVGILPDDPSGPPVMFMKGLRFLPVELHSSEAKGLEDAKIAQMVWKPSVDFYDPRRLVSVVSTESFARTNQMLEELFILCGSAALDEIGDIDNFDLETQPHLEKHHQWLKSRIYTSERLYPPIKPEVRQSEIERLSSDLEATPASAVATLIKRCYIHATSLFSCKIGALEVFLQDNALHELYDWMNALFSYKALLQLLSHKQGRHLRVLEVGAGTGGLTARILKDLTDCFDDGNILGKYVFTDVSAGFFPAARSRFEKVPAGFVDYRVLDISRNPAEQGFGGEQFDLIVASNVLHATPDLTQTLRHAKSLLKPDGRLLMHELCCHTKWINFIMGYLSGWWLGEPDNRPDEPYIAPEQWERRLKAAGFSQTDIFYDSDIENKLNATIIARPTVSVGASSEEDGCITLLCEQSSHPVTVELCYILENRGYSVSCLTLSSAIGQVRGPVISIVDLCRIDGYFHDMTESKLDAFKRVLQALQSEDTGILWVTRACQVKPADPSHAPVLGVARTVRAEMGLPFATLEVDEINEEALKAVCEVFGETFKEPGHYHKKLGRDMEFSLSSGRILVPRCKWRSTSCALQATREASSTRMLRILKPGALQTLHWVSRDLPRDLPADAVRIRVHAAGFNFKDVVTAMGLINPSSPEGLGCEASGVVTATGGKVSKVRVGDRVMVFAPQAACFSTDIQVLAQLCSPIPDTLSFTDAASMPCIFVTVLRALVDKAGLRAGQSVLIHSAAGGVGIAAMQIARWIGAKIYVTVGRDEKARFVSREWQIPRENVFSSLNANFVDEIKAATCGQGVDVVLNSLSGELLHASWDCVAPNGTFIELGKRDTLSGARLAMAAFDGNRSFIGVEMANLASQDPSVISRLLDQCVEMYQQGNITPVKPIRVFPVNEVEDAFRYLYQGTHIGKAVLSLDGPIVAGLDAVSTIPTPRFRSNVSYLLVGGMKGLGGSIARWMAFHGANDIVFLSRSAGTGAGDQTLLAELRGMGCNISVVPCDVTDEESLQAAVLQVSSRKRIAGVLNLAMVLWDGAFPTLTLPQWQAATNPKIQGTWNLDRALPPDLDFFVLFGSLSGVHGYPGQANYAAANTFLDSFAQYRRAKGLPCSVVDLGGVEDVGYVSRNQEVESAMLKAGARLVSEADMLQSLQLAISRAKPFDDISDEAILGSQLMVGLDCTVSIDDPGNRVVWKQDARMAHYPNKLESSATSHIKLGNSGLADFITRLQSAPQDIDTPASVAHLAGEIALRVSGFLMREVDKGDVDTSLSPSALGVDSLMTIEIRNWWKHLFGVDISVLQLTSAQSFDQLGQLAAKQLKDRISAQTKE